MFIYWFVPIAAVIGFISALRETSVLTTIENLKGNENFLMSFFAAIPQEAFAYLGQVEPLVMNYYPLFVLGVLIFAILNVLRSKYSFQIDGIQTHRNQPNEMIVYVVFTSAIFFTCFLVPKLTSYFIQYILLLFTKFKKIAFSGKSIDSGTGDPG